MDHSSHNAIVQLDQDVMLGTNVLVAVMGRKRQKHSEGQLTLQDLVVEKCCILHYGEKYMLIH